jgi:hypothetical protein
VRDTTAPLYQIRQVGKPLQQTGGVGYDEPLQHGGQAGHTGRHRQVSQIHMDIRRAQASDTGALLALVRLFPTQTPPTEKAYDKSFQAKLNDPASCVLIAELNGEQSGEAIGYVAGYQHPTFYSGGPTAWIDEILMVERLRGPGIG